MGISITEDAVIVDGGRYDFYDLYIAAWRIGSAVVQRLSNTYLITTNLILQNNAYVSAVNTNITITGSLLQIRSGSTLKLGQLKGNGRGKMGCILTMPNVLTEYGFGSIITDDSANLLAYASMINAYSYWSFFAGDNRVELIDCIIDGYGKISGPNSRVRNTTFKRAHGKYGSLIYTGTIKEFRDIDIDYVESYEDDMEDGGSNFLFDIRESTDEENLEIFYGKYSGYSKLLNIMDSMYDFDIIMYGTTVENGYNIERENSNRNSFYHKFRFSPRMQTSDGLVITHAPVKITNKLGEVEFEGETNSEGYIDCWLTYYRDLAGPSPGDIITPHKVEITHEGKTVIAVIYVTRNMEEFPILIRPSEEVHVGGGCDIDADAIRAIVEDVHHDTNANVQTLVGEMQKVILAMGEQIKEGQTVIKGRGQKMVL